MELKLVNTGILRVNTWLVPLTENSVFITDPACCDLTGDSDVLIRYLDDNRITPAGIFLTHGHFDHVMGLKCLKERWPDLPICIHKNDAPCIGKTSLETQQKFLASMGHVNSDFVSALTNLPQADYLLSDGITFDKAIPSAAPEIIKALSEWKVIHTPGHTSGCVCFYNEKEKQLIAGDTIFFGSYGRTDLYDGNEAQIKKSIVKVIETLPKDVKIYPGHDRFGFTLESYSPF